MNLNVRENGVKNVPYQAETNGTTGIYYPESDGKPMAETDTHITLIATLLTTLRTFYAEQADVYVAGDMMFYYEKDNPRKFIAPDVMVVRGVAKYPRRVFKLWEENVPEVILEISSRETWREDLQKKYFIYREIGVKEYYIFDPEYKYLKDDFLVAYRLKDGEYEEIRIENNKIFSPALGLEIVNTGETLRLYNPETESFLPTNDELAAEVKQKDEEINFLKAELAKLKAEN